MALPEIPDANEVARQVDESLLPAFLLGLVTITGPIDDQDRQRARRILEVTETREALAA